jgi:hypothetical protein
MVKTESDHVAGAHPNGQVGRELARVSAEGTDAKGFAVLMRALAGSAKLAGAGAVTSGRWLVDTAVDLAGQLPVRTLPVLQAQYPNLNADAIADELTAQAAKATGAVGAIAGGLAAAEWFAPPTWFAAPLELVTETLAVAAIEMRLIGELHAAYERPIPTVPLARAGALAHAWANSSAVSPEYSESAPTPGELWAAAAKKQMQRTLRRRLARRAGRNAASFLPFLVGAAAGAKLNHGATAKLSEAVRRELRSTQKAPPLRR